MANVSVFGDFEKREHSEQEDAEHLAQTLEQVQEKFVNKWTGAQFSQFLTSIRSQHSGVMQQTQDEIEEKLKQLENIRSQAANRDELSVKHAKALAELKQQLQVASMQADALLQENERIEQTVEKLSVENEQHNQKLLSQEEASTKKQQELEKAVHWFEERLGLKLKRISGGRLQLIFTCIDPDDNAAPYYFCVKINADGTYLVSECQPEVSDLPQLVEKLNKTNNFRSFVITMRSRFQALIQN